MDIQEIEKHIDKRTGLVPILIVQAYAPYVSGQVAGFPAEAAVLHINGGIGRLPSKTEMKAKESPVIDPAPVHGGDGEQRQHAYDRRPEVSPRAQTAPATLQGPASPLPAAAIAENWKDLGVAERRKLAANLSLRRYQEISGEQADVIIQEAQDHAASGAGSNAPAHASVPGVITSTALPGGANETGSNSGNGGQS